MAEKKKGKKRKEEYVIPGEEVIVKPSKNEYNIAKWLRKNVPIKKTKFLNHNVEYFTGSKAVDALLDSKWAKDETAVFKTREEIVDFLHLMLEHKFFHRARKVPVSEQELKSKKKEKKSSIESSDEKKDKEKEKSEKVGGDGESETKAETVAEKDKRKRKIRLEMHNDQRFVDSLDAYVWIYDPIPFHYWIIGTLFVLGAIGICLFPLWPPSVRLGVYYLSVAAAGFLVFTVFLVVLRLIIFCTVWLLTVGKHHIWILPNLTEDVGFFESFWPLYKYKYKGVTEASNSKKEKKKKKEKHSDDEGENEDNKQDEQLKPESSTVRQRKVDNKESSEKKSETHTSTTDGSGSRIETVITNGGSESESESSQRSSTGKDFEIVDQDDLEES